MKAIVLRKTAPVEDKPLGIVDLPRPDPTDDQIVLQVSVCGLCHTDLDQIEGRLTPPKLPVVLGHQVVGTVATKGPKADRYNTGDRVGVTWLYWACSECEFCKTGRENLCNEAKWTGKDAHGGYAEYMVVSEKFAYPIPGRFSDSQAAPLLCAGVIGYRAVRLCEIADGEIVGLFGFGASAHIVIQIVRHRFPNSDVFVFTRSSEHRDLAKHLGAAWAGLPGEQPPAKVNRAIDFTPVGEAVRDALFVMDKGGRLVINAIRKATPVPELDYAKYLWHEREIKSVANVTRLDAEEFLPLADQIPIEPHVQEFGFEQVGDALIAIKQARIRAAAVLRVCQRRI
ncbi:MAG: zinc-dependent alcohol dehydrogenase family protein [Phycisphaerales bacterium]|nr:MAG: zinc-dependent alcohol dehydrogenase family protein [Phycisphaerales bacterium]